MAAAVANILPGLAMGNRWSGGAITQMDDAEPGSHSNLSRCDCAEYFNATKSATVAVLCIVGCAYALHSAVISDLATIKVSSCPARCRTTRLFLTGLAISRQADMRFLGIDDYLAETQCAGRSNGATSRSNWPMPGRLDIDHLFFTAPVSRKSSSTGSGGRTDRYSAAPSPVVDTRRSEVRWLRLKNCRG